MDWFQNKTADFKLLDTISHEMTKAGAVIDAQMAKLQETAAQHLSLASIETQSFWGSFFSYLFVIALVVLAIAAFRMKFRKTLFNNQEVVKPFFNNAKEEMAEFERVWVLFLINIKKIIDVKCKFFASNLISYPVNQI